ncbi:MAG: hypothetical protein KBC16_00025 [Candidatus Pacebacteria bacterium]|nr:hypothetical protein [Candidatus Paceibacterota bacterium]
MKKVATILTVIAVVIIVIFLVASGIFMYGAGLPLNQVAGFRVTEEVIDGSVVLTLSGLDMNSAKCVTGITERKYEDLVVVVVRDRVATGRCSGSFTYKLFVPEEVRIVAFGTVHDVVWTRSE